MGNAWRPLRGRAAAAWPAAILVIVTVLASPIDAACAEGTREFTRRFPVRVELDAGSRIVEVAAPAHVPAELRPLLERSVARAAFRAGERDGQPRPSKLWVTVSTGITIDADDRMRARVLDVAGGGGLRASMWVARTPSLAVPHGVGADVAARVVFSSGSRIDRAESSIESVSLRPGPGGEMDAALADELVAHFRAAVQRDLRDWRWIPDEVDGVKLRGEFRVPIRFPSRPDREAQGPAGIHPQPVEFVPVASTPMLVPPRLLSWTPAVAAGVTTPGRDE